MVLKKSGVSQAVRAHLDPKERPVHTVSTVDGATIAVSPTHVTVVQGDDVQLREAWCVFSQMAWDEGDGLLRFVFIDPGLAPITFTLADAPSLDFLTAAREGVDSAHVFSAGTKLGNGTAVKSWILRDSHGELFSLTTASGPIAPGDVAEVDRLERKTREAAGLDPA
ncbi:MAG: hypothetical protein E7A62_09425 [Actinomycetaceae bacterium]|nr:hypothetical protein [Actinomycetaceae bacterium]MDU0971191.1 hypothetical protein [Actinomycetaceae bacterium]